MRTAATFVISRLGTGLLAVAGVQLTVFVLIRIVPGDPVTLIAGLNASPEELASARAALGLDQPIPLQLWHYFGDLITGHFGISAITHQPVVGEVLRSLLNSLLLVVLTIPIVTALGISLGLAAAYRQESRMDRAVTFLATAGMSIPPFFLAILLIELFAVYLHWLPATGFGTPAHLVLPVLTLTVSALPYVIRMTRGAVLEMQTANFVRTAEAKGLGRITVLTRHVFRNCMIPISTVVGLQTAYMVGGVALVETVFAYPGIGWLLVEAIYTRDFPIVQTGVLFVAVVVVIVNLLTDMTYLAFDPRLRSASSLSSGRRRA